MANLYGFDNGGTVNGRDTSSSFAGDPFFKVADSAPAGYVQIDGTATAADADNAIAWWVCYAEYTGYDYLYVNKKIKTIRDVHGYAALSTDTKKILLKRFSAGAGNDWVDGLYTSAEYETFFVDHETNMNIAASNRNSRAMAKLKREVYLGNITLSDAESVGNATFTLRQEFVEDLKLGISEGDANDGILDWIENTNGLAGLTLIGVDVGLSEFEVNENMQNKIITGQLIRISGSTANDGVYTVDSVRKQQGDTFIKTLEAIPDATVDGVLYWTGFKVYDAWSQALQDEMAEMYRNGI